MFNPFRIFSLAADARRAETVLDHAGFYIPATLTAKAQAAVGYGIELRRRLGEAETALNYAHTDLDRATAKIERMTSGLRRGSKAKAVRLQDARAPHDAAA